MVQFKDFWAGKPLHAGMVGLQASRVWGEPQPETIGEVERCIIAWFPNQAPVYQVLVYTCTGGRFLTGLSYSDGTFQTAPTRLEWWVASATQWEAEAWVEAHAKELGLCKEAARTDPGQGN